MHTLLNTLKQFVNYNLIFCCAMGYLSSINIKCNIDISFEFTLVIYFYIFYFNWLIYIDSLKYTIIMIPK